MKKINPIAGYELSLQKENWKKTKKMFVLWYERLQNKILLFYQNLPPTTNLLGVTVELNFWKILYPNK